MKSIYEMEFCNIIEAACPYDHGCSVCRLRNDYEEAIKKSQVLVESLEAACGQNFQRTEV